MIKHGRQQGFALFAAAWMIAIIGLISLGITHLYLGNTRITQFELRRIQAEHLLNAGVRFAALTIAAPRNEVVANAIPAAQLNYRSAIGVVSIDIANEAGRIDLRHAPGEFIDSLLDSYPISQSEESRIQQHLYEVKLEQIPATFRRLREGLNLSPGMYHRLATQTTFYNGQPGVHLSLASEEVLSLIPDLAPANRKRLLKRRGENGPTLFSSPIESAYFSQAISPHYRITSSTVLDGHRFSRIQIIKMLNQPGQLFSVVATL